MDRSSSTKQIHYVFEKNSQPNQANQNKSRIENNKTDKIRNLAVKKESIMIEGTSHKFIIFYESEALSAEKIFNNPFVKLKTENNTKAVQKNFRNLLLNKKIDPNKIKTMEESLFFPINVPRPFNKSEKSILNKLNNISDENNKLANELTELKSNLNNKEIALNELNKFLKIFKELNLASDEVKNLFHTIYGGNLSDAELISLLKPISISNEKRKIEEELKNLDSNSEKLSDEDLTALNVKLASLNQELDILKNVKDIKNFEDKLKTLENSADEKSIALIIKLKNTINNLKIEPKILEISNKNESIKIALKTHELLVAKNLLGRNLIISKISSNKSLSIKELQFLEKFINDVSFDEKSTSFIIKDKYLWDDMSNDQVSSFDKKLEILNKIPKENSSSGEEQKFLSDEDQKYLKNLIGEKLSQEESTIVENLTSIKSLEIKNRKGKLLKINSEKELLENISDLNKKLGKNLSSKSNIELLSDINYLLSEDAKLTKQLNGLKSSIKNKLSDTELNALITELGTKSSQKLSSPKIGIKINPNNEKITSLVNKLNTEKDALKAKIPNLEAEFNNKLKERSGLVQIQHKNEKLSLKEGAVINLTDANLFYDNIVINANNFGIEIRENTSQPYVAKSSTNTATESISNHSDSTSLSNKENIASTEKTNSKVTDKSNLLSQSGSTTSYRSLERPDDFLTRKQPKTATISSDSITTINTNFNSRSSADSERPLASSSSSSSISEKKSYDFFTKTNDLPNKEKIASPSGFKNESTPRNRSLGKSTKAGFYSDAIPKSSAIIKNTDLDKDNSTTTNSTPLISSKSSTASGNDSMVIPTNEPKND